MLNDSIRQFSGRQNENDTVLAEFFRAMERRLGGQPARTRVYASRVLGCRADRNPLRGYVDSLRTQNP